MVNSHLSGEGLPAHRIHSRLEIRAGSPLECQPLNSRKERVGDEERERFSGYILVNCAVSYWYDLFLLSFIVIWKYFTISNPKLSGRGVGVVRYEFGAWKRRMASHRVLHYIVYHSCFVFFFGPRFQILLQCSVVSLYIWETPGEVKTQGYQ
jgi:hypothetical protein